MKSSMKYHLLERNEREQTMIFDALTIGQLKVKIKDLPNNMPVYIDDEGEECMRCISIQKRTLTTYDLDADKELEIQACVLGIS